MPLRDASVGPRVRRDRPRRGCVVYPVRSQLALFRQVFRSYGVPWCCVHGSPRARAPIVEEVQETRRSCGARPAVRPATGMPRFIAAATNEESSTNAVPTLVWHKCHERSAWSLERAARLARVRFGWETATRLNTSEEGRERSLIHGHPRAAVVFKDPRKRVERGLLELCVVVPFPLRIGGNAANSIKKD